MARRAASNGVLPHTSPSNEAPVLLNCDHGDPTMFEAYWDDAHKDDHMMVSYANDTLSYFVKSKSKMGGGPWFVSADLDDAVREIHAFVGNAVTKDRVIVVGTGSTQLFQAALYGLATRNGASTAVVAESPYYSAYPQIINYLDTKLFHWAGDSKTYQPKADQKFIQMVTSPNNPCGSLREGSVSGGNGIVVHDLAYYWPAYTPMTMPLDHDIMLFTLSKCTGHAGLRIGWAIVKDPEVAKKMADYIATNTIGLSQDAQIRAAGLMRATIRGYEGESTHGLACSAGDVHSLHASRKFFHWSKAVMEGRWERVRHALAGNPKFSVPDPSMPATCTFLGTAYSAYSAFIWLKCEEEDADCQMVLKSNGILARGGSAFGVSAQFARLSLLDRKQALDVLVQRLAALR